MGMRALVILSAVVAAAWARPGQLAAVQSPVADPASSKAPPASPSSNQEGGVGGTSPVSDSLESSRPDNPTLSLKTSDGSDDSTGVRIVDNPHIGLPVGAVLPDSVLPVRDVPISRDDSKNIRFVDNPHIGLPAGTVLPLPGPGDPVRDSLESSRPENPTKSLQSSDSRDDSKGVRIVDNPHMGLPVGAVVPDSVLPVRDVPTGRDDSKDIRFVDNPHIGLPFGALLPLPGPVFPVRDSLESSRPDNPTMSLEISDGRDDSKGIRIVDNPHTGLPVGAVLPLPGPAVPVRDSLESSRPDNPTMSLQISDSSDDSTSVRIVDNPHIGLPVGAVLPDSLFPVRDVPTASTANTLNTLRRDCPHVGLPPIIPDLDSSVSSDRVNVNRGATSFVGQPKTQFANCVDPDVFKALFPNSRPIHSTRVFIPARSPMPHLTSNARLHDTSGSSSFPTINGNSNFFVSNPLHGIFTTTTNSKFANIPSLSFTTTSNPNKFFPSSTAKSPTSNTRIPIPINTNPFGYPIGSRNFYRPSFNFNIPGHLFLFTDNVPHGNVVHTAEQGAVVVGGPFNVAIFPKQPSLDEINQVLAESGVAAAPAVPAAGSPAFSPPAGNTV